MPLTDMRIRSAKPAAKLQKLSDGGGLQLWLMPEPSASKLWRLAYRFDGKQKTVAIGPYPLIGLADARAKRDELRRIILDGRDPGEERKRAKLTKAISDANTFDALADELLDRKRREERAAATLAKTEWLLGFAREALGPRPIVEISAAEILAVLRTVEKRGRLESARRLRSVIGEVFRLAIATARAANDPTIALRGALIAPKVKHRAAILEPKALGGLLRAIDGFQGQPTTIAALKLMALLFPRPGELRMAEWSEFDLAAAVWTIPASRTKTRREHRVPLPPQALAILEELRTITGRGKLAFPGYGVGSRAGKPIEQRPISENTMVAALRRMGFEADVMSAHGFRATASTLLNESGLWSPDSIERALAHVERDDVRRAYARGAYWEERVRMAAWWAEYLDGLRHNI